MNQKREVRSLDPWPHQKVMNHTFHPWIPVVLLAVGAGVAGQMALI